MADADEDVIPAASQDQPGDGEDGEDETQDFRFLANLTGGKSSQSANLKRGIKDFEPNPTQSQATALDESRLAMYNALSETRSQTAKNHNVGQFVDERRRGNPWDLRLRGDLRGDDWDVRCVVVYKFKSTFSRTIGRADHRSWTWLLPEEALYLLERGTLDIRWPDAPASEQVEQQVDEEKDEAARGEAHADKDDENEPIGELPMSLQGAYATFVGRHGLNMDRYLVYTGLRRLGYIVQRAPSWSDFEHTTTESQASDDANASTAPSYTTTSSQPSLISRLMALIANPRRGTSCPTLGPLLAPGLYRDYNDVFRSLHLISHAAGEPPRPKREPNGPFTIAYHVWRPSSPFKKTAPPAPDFRVCVLDARATDVPTMTEIGTLLDSMPADELPADKRAEAKIKHGTRSVILAIVDIGVVSYLRFNEASIGRHKIYEEKTARAQKGRARGGGGGGGGARGGRGGRGRGRGRGNG